MLTLVESTGHSSNSGLPLIRYRRVLKLRLIHSGHHDSAKVNPSLDTGYGPGRPVSNTEIDEFLNQYYFTYPSPVTNNDYYLYISIFD